MIEAQAMYINTLIKKVKAGRDRGGNISIEPKLSVDKAYNEEIQARLSKSAFADPNCNSWYKNDAGLITNNWSDAVIPYQKRTSTLNWDDFEINGPGAEDIKKEGKVSWPRVIEETQISNTMVLAGIVTAAGAVIAGAVTPTARKALSRR